MTVQVDGYPKIAGLAFDSDTNKYTVANTADFLMLASYVSGGGDISGLEFNFTATEYTINDLNELRALADYFNGGGDTSGLTFKLAQNISGVNFHIGDSDAHRFKGTFDGNGHTVTVKYNVTENYCALFRYVEGATIQKLTVDGTINTSKQCAASIAAYVYGTTNITDCRSSVTINSTVSGVAAHGGLVATVANNNDTLNLTNCIFDGKLLGSKSRGCGGLVGGLNKTSNANVTNCLFAPSEVTLLNEYNDTLICGSGTVNLNGGYYTQALTNVQGTQVYKLTLPKIVTATGDTVVTFSNNTYAAGEVTLTANTGYVISGGNSVNVSADTTITATLDTANHYVLSNDTKTLATTANTTTYPDLIQVYEITLPEGATASGDIVVTDGGKTYAAGEVTIAGKTDYIFSGNKSLTVTDNYTVTFDTENHYVLADNTSTLATEENTATYPDLIQTYKVILNGVTASGDDIYLTDNNIAYVKTGSTITLATKDGYTVTSSAIINSDETISATLDDTNHYIFGTEGNYTVATADNVNTNNYPDLTRVYKITVPEGFNITSDKYEIGTDIYVAANAQVTIAATDTNKLIRSATVEDGTLTDGVYTLTATKDLAVTAPILIWNFAKIFTDAEGTSNTPYTLDTAEKLGYLTDNVSVGEDYSGKYFKLTSGIGSEVKNIGDATNQFKGTATLGAGVKVSFNGGATIEVTSGEITFNADTSTFDSLDNGDKFKVGNTEYTVGENCILQSGKVWLNPSTVTIDELNTENNWTVAVDGTITLSATSETIYFYGTDGKKVANFNGSTLTKETSSTAITAIDASALTSAITINGFYNENTTITAGSVGVNVNVDGNKFSVVNGAFKFDGSKLINGTATLSTVNDAVKVGDNFITLTVGDGITVNASDSTIGGLNSGDKFTIGTDNYEVAANGIIKNNSAIHAIAESLAISSDDNNR